MDLSAASLWEWTKLMVRAPATAARAVKVAGLPMEVSVLLIVLAGVLSGVATGVLDTLVPSPPMEVALQDGSTMVFLRGGPFMQGLYSVLSGLALAYAVYAVGRRMGGQGSLADLMGIVAVLQMVMVVILLAQTLSILFLPILGAALLLFGLVVFFRGLGHGVNVGHEFGDMGRSVLVIILSVVAVALTAFLVVMIFGIGPEVRPIGENG